MDQRRDGCRAGHGIGKPEIERELRRLATRSDEQQDGDCGSRAGGDSVGVHAVEKIDVLDRPERAEGHEHGDHEAPVANAIGDECLLAGAGIGFAGVPERDQEVATRADTFPTE